jgi:hypothetical protein
MRHRLELCDLLLQLFLLLLLVALCKCGFLGFLLIEFIIDGLFLLLSIYHASLLFLLFLNFLLFSFLFRFRLFCLFSDFDLIFSQELFESFVLLFFVIALELNAGFLSNWSLDCR